MHCFVKQFATIWTLNNSLMGGVMCFIQFYYMCILVIVIRCPSDMFEGRVENEMNYTTFWELVFLNSILVKKS